MARIDKVVPGAGSFRAPLAVDWLSANLNAVIAVSLNASGQVAIGTAAQSGYVGVVVLSKIRYAGEVVDVLRIGEVVEFDRSGPANAAFAPAVAGQVYYANAAGPAEVTAPVAGTNKGRIGHTVEAGRLIVHASMFQG